MEAFIANYIGEVLVGFIMILVGWSIKNWAANIQESNTKILKNVAGLATEFHNYRVATENRVTKVEEKVYHLEKTFFITLANQEPSNNIGGGKS